MRKTRHIHAVELKTVTWKKLQTRETPIYRDAL
jgi:hypothetical protein